MEESLSYTKHTKSQNGAFLKLPNQRSQNKIVGGPTSSAKGLKRVIWQTDGIYKYEYSINQNITQLK